MLVRYEWYSPASSLSTRIIWNFLFAPVTLPVYARLLTTTSTSTSKSCLFNNGMTSHSSLPATMIELPLQYAVNLYNDRIGAFSLLTKNPHGDLSCQNCCNRKSPDQSRVRGPRATAPTVESSPPRCAPGTLLPERCPSPHSQHRRAPGPRQHVWNGPPATSWQATHANE